MDSGVLAEPVIGPATSGRTRWLGPGMTARRLFRRRAKHYFVLGGKLRRFEPRQFRCEFEPQLRPLLFRQPVGHLREDGAVE
jgi:hypothetical protein